MRAVPDFPAPPLPPADRGGTLVRMTHDHSHHHHDHGHADLSGPAESPILIEVTRGGMVESVHRGRACLVDAAGHVLAQWGDIAAPIYPRSAIAAIQAIPLVESGALDAFELGDSELALACASHSGEIRHTRLLESWLKRLDLTPEDLACGPQTPTDPDSAADLIRDGEPPTVLHNTASGKHAGFLTTARHLGKPIQGYARFDHPVQQRVLGVLEQMTGQDLSRAPWGVDNCALPTIGVPLGALAYAMARLADPVDLPDARADAVARITKAWKAHPHLIGGKDSFDTRMMQASGGRVLVKSGAEGVGCVVLPKEGVGIALKIEDGSARARDVALAALIRAADALTEEQWTRAADLLTVPLVNRAGREVGVIRVAEGSLSNGE